MCDQITLWCYLVYVDSCNAETDIYHSNCWATLPENRNLNQHFSDSMDRKEEGWCVDHKWGNDYEIGNRSESL